MAKDFAKKFYDSAAWKKCRRSFIAQRQAIDGGLCQDCREQPGKIIHHVVPIDENNINDPDITLNFHNLKYVCHKCHEETEHRRGFKYGVRCKPKRPEVPGAIKYYFDKDGNPIPRG